MTRDLCASHVRKVRGVVSALAAVLACVGLCVPSAVASDGVDWRVDGMGVRDAWASGITGKGVKVAVLDNRLSRAGGRGRVVQAGDRGRPALLSGNR